MLTPIFSISQTDNEVIFKLRLPYVKISTADIFVEGRLFRFFLHPYYLSLELKQDMKTDAISSCVYDHNDYYLTVSVTKKEKGEFFDDLELITSLLSKKKEKVKPNKKPLIEVISETNDPDYEEEKVNKLSLNEELKGLTLHNFGCGFNNTFTGFFKDLKVS